uniref:Solute carrier family 25 member 25 n=1 Tax=Sus scrofa TaxID=9823 RepID=A0A4X1U5L9_PIG
MLCLCLYVPLMGEAQTEFQYFESKGLPAELKSIFKLSVFIPSQEFSTFRQWKQLSRGESRLKGYVKGVTGSHVTSQKGWNYREAFVGDGEEFFCGEAGSEECGARMWGHGSGCCGALSELGAERPAGRLLVGAPGVGTVASEVGGDRAVP